MTEDSSLIALPTVIKQCMVNGLHTDEDAEEVGCLELKQAHRLQHAAAIWAQLGNPTSREVSCGHCVTKPLHQMEGVPLHLLQTR